jgi:hypothetical protein
MWGGVVRLVAIVLIMGTLVDLVGIDLYGAIASTSGQSSGPSSSCNDTDVQTDCFCCCVHVMVPSTVVLSVSLVQSRAIAPDAAIIRFVIPESLFHPPRA